MLICTHTQTLTDFLLPAATCMCYFRIFLQKLDWSIEIRSIVRTFLFSDVRNMCVTQYNSSVLFLKGYSGPWCEGTPLLSSSSLLHILESPLPFFFFFARESILIAKFFCVDFYNYSFRRNWSKIKHSLSCSSESLSPRILYSVSWVFCYREHR